jgi:amidohydrolase
MDKNLSERLITLRRQLHQFPELGYQEYKTAELISGELKRLGIDHKTTIAKTGIVATLKKGEGPCVVLRADMDALPMQEETGLPFASKLDHVMHACGHDVHTTMLLGAASLLKNKDFKGTLKLVFQPSEEGTNNDPENKSGGQRVMESGELDEAHAALALHVHPLMDVGTIGFTPGLAMAANHCFKLVIHGKSGHAAFPHMGIDAILVATHLIQSAQAIVSRYTSPIEPVVLSFTKIEGGVAQNVIAEKVHLEGTIRAFDLKSMERVIERLNQMIEGVSTSFSAHITLEFNLRYPSLLNDSSVHSKIGDSLSAVFGNENVIEIDPMLASEDFAFYSRKIPSMFYFLGAKPTASDPFFLHHPKMQVNETCIVLGATFLTEAALELVKNLS